jgi:hypothetical protein
MALNPNAVGTAIAAAVAAAAPPAGTAITPTQLENLWKTIAADIFSVSGGVAGATVTVTVVSVSGVTTGPGVSGPGAGTGVIT